MLFLFYRIQTFKIAGNSKELFTIYATIARPAIVKKFKLSSLPTDPLWLDSKGKAEKRMSRNVIAFFKQNCSLHITTTTLRAIVEMESHNMLQLGEISPLEREAISNSSGHALTSTVKVYYIRIIYIFFMHLIKL
jgi:hypothetical protein